MKFLVIGGTGGMGRRVVKELAVADGTSLVTIAGRNEATGRQVLAAARAAQLAAGIPADQRATVQFSRLDVTDQAALVAAMARHDVSAGAMGPFYLYEEPLVRAAIQARRSYVSMCDDTDAVAKVLPLDEEAVAADISVLTGLGWTPGLTNLAACHGAAQLDETFAVHMAWAGSSAGGVGRAVALHVWHVFSGVATTVLDGTAVQVPAASGAERVTFPHPIGPITVRHVSHPETLTLPHYIPGLRAVTLKGGLPEPVLNWVNLVLCRLGLVATHRRRSALWPLLKVIIPSLGRIGAPPGGNSAMLVTVSGQRGGQPTTITATAIGPMADLTALPTAVGALWLARGKIKRRGVFAPEAPGGPDPAAFLAAIAARGVTLTWHGLNAPPPQPKGTGTPPTAGSGPWQPANGIL